MTYSHGRSLEKRIPWFRRFGIDRMPKDCPSPNLPVISTVMKFAELCDRGEVITFCRLNSFGSGLIFGSIGLVHFFTLSLKEPIGWVRTVRSAGIDEEQQHFIVRIEGSFHSEVTQTPILERGRMKPGTNAQVLKLTTAKEIQQMGVFKGV
jgi:hypothetical protein